MEYEGFIGSVEYSKEDGVFHGTILNVMDTISYEGANLAGLEKDFHDTVEYYKDLCSYLNKKIKIIAL